jgi:peptidoglycan/xylan/chitin deacetylase (PgdA/CDA1 family)
LTFALIYHDVVRQAERERTGFPGSLAARYKLAPADFEAHLEAMSASGVGVGLLGLGGDGPAAAITFDDGGASALDAAAALERRGWRGHFFITTGRIDTPGFLDTDGVRELARRGHGVGSHSHSHPTYMGKLPRETILTEWLRSRDELGNVLGEPPLTASVPGGFLSSAVIETAADAGYRLLMTSEPTAKRRRCGGMVVLGRYTIWSTTSPRRAAGYAQGSRIARAQLWTEWTAKKLPKTLAPGVYQAMRRLRASRR